MGRPVDQGGIGRRRVLGIAGSSVAAGLAGFGVGARVERPGAGAPAGTGGGDVPSTVQHRLAASDDVVDASGSLPQGLRDRPPAFGQVIALDLRHDQTTRGARRAAVAVLRGLSAVADEAADGSPADAATGAAALGIRPASLQVTVGVGASLLHACGLERPSGLVDVPGYSTDRLQAPLCGGDLLVQVGAEDPMRLAATVQRVLAASTTHAVPRWTRAGFRPTQAASEQPDATTRNLMGHLDGTANSPRSSPLWRSTVTTRDSSWMDGGSYLVVRQIRIRLAEWFGHEVSDRDQVIGRRTLDGAPLGRRREQEAVDLDGLRADGAHLVPEHAHIRLASTRNTAGARIYRRSWNYDAGWEANGERDAGLIFLAWQADPRRGFLPIQRSLSEGLDALNTYTTHIGSGLFAMPARGDDDYLGERIFRT